MSEDLRALAMCSKAEDVPADQRPPGAEERPCEGCAATLVVSPSSLAVPNVACYCNDCGPALVIQQMLAGKTPIAGFAPGAWDPDNPEMPFDPRETRRLRKGLEARGFIQLNPEDFE